LIGARLTGDTARAMSQENVEIVRSFYDQWTRDDSPPIELMDPEIEYVNPAGAVEPGTRHGLDAFTKAVEKVFEGWEAWQMKPEQFESVGDQVAVVVRYRARGRGSGVEVEGRESALWTLRDGKVVRYAWFHEPGDALEAAGLRE
jgi:ketosteroid isomerase-like protein